MKAAVLRDDIKESSRADDLDNLHEADFVQSQMMPEYEVKQIPFSADIARTIAELRSFKPDVVFNLVESCDGMGALAVIATEVLEALGFPFTGNRTFAHLLSADKALAKRLMIQAGIPTPSAEFQSGKKYILKAKTEHASIGLDESCILVPQTAKALEAALQEKEQKTGMAWIAEHYIDGREFNVALLGNEVLPPAEMCFSKEFNGHKILTYEAKWHEETEAYLQSTRSFDIEKAVKQDLVDIAIQCRDKLQLKGYSRVDFRMDAQGGLYVIDMNTNPCISPDSGFAAMAAKAGITQKEMIKRIVNDAFVS